MLAQNGIALSVLQSAVFTAADAALTIWLACSVRQLFRVTARFGERFRFRWVVLDRFLSIGTACFAVIVTALFGLDRQVGPLPLLGFMLAGAIAMTEVQIMRYRGQPVALTLGLAVARKLRSKQTS